MAKQMYDFLSLWPMSTAQDWFHGGLPALPPTGMAVVKKTFSTFGAP